MDGDIDGLAFEVFEGETKFIGIVLLFFSELKIGEHVFELMENVIINVFGSSFDEVFWFLVIGHQNQVPERFGHEELLEH